MEKLVGDASLNERSRLTKGASCRFPLEKARNSMKEGARRLRRKKFSCRQWRTEQGSGEDLGESNKCHVTRSRAYSLLLVQTCGGSPVVPENSIIHGAYE